MSAASKMHPASASASASATTSATTSTSLPPMRRRVPALDFRFFHHTPDRSSSALLAAVTLGTVTVMGLKCLKKLPKTHYMPGEREAETKRTMQQPPYSWHRESRAYAPKKLDIAHTIVSTGFAMARQRPPETRDDDLREATFQVPYEVAPLNPNAPKWTLEDMGPLVTPEGLSLTTIHVSGEGVPKNNTLFKNDDVRVFLYVPNGASKATAYFLSVNYDMEVHLGPSAGKEMCVADFEGGMTVTHAWNVFLANLKSWFHAKPELLDRIEPGPLPVIINFRQDIGGITFDAKSILGPDAIVSMPLNGQLPFIRFKYDSEGHDDAAAGR